MKINLNAADMNSNKDTNCGGEGLSPVKIKKIKGFKFYINGGKIFFEDFFD